MPSAVTFEGLEVSPEDEVVVRKCLRALIKDTVAEGKPIFDTTATIGFNAIAVEEIVNYFGYDSVFRLTSLFVGHRTVSDDWLEQIALKTGKPYNRPERKAESIYDYKLGPYTAFNYLSSTDLLITYHPDKPKVKEGTVLAAIIREAKKRRIPILNLYHLVHNDYRKSEYPGVRKRKGCQTWYYRIKRKLPNGEEVIKEKGGFKTEYEANLARVESLREMTVKEQNEGKKENLIFKDLFEEYINFLKDSKSEALIKKYMSIYNAQLKDECGDYQIGRINYGMVDDYINRLQYFIFNKGKKQYSQSYVNAIKKLLNLVFDYAYNQGYITTHPMFGLPITWPKPNKG